MAQKGKGRRSYLNDFHMDVSGQYVYTGAVYMYAGQMPLRRFQAALGVLAAVLAAAVIAAGCVPAPAMMNCFYVILPYIGEVIGAALSVWAVARLAWHSPELRAYVHHATVERLPGRLWVTLGFAAAGVIANAVYLCLNGAGETPLYTWLPFVCQAAVIAIALVLQRQIGVAQWRSGGETPATQ